MQFTSESYRIAAREHIRRAEELHSAGSYYAAHYYSGLAAKCVLRAFLRLRTRQFTRTHDLRELAKVARFSELVRPEEQEVVGAALNQLNLRWRSNQRFQHEKQFWSYLADLKADFHQKDDRQKNNSRTAYNLAYRIVIVGEKRWKSA